MTRENDDIQIINKIVTTVDICSSSHIIEDLIKTGNIKAWRDVLIEMKDYLVSNASNYGAEIYKFIGDGWIILFSKPYSATNIVNFLIGINQTFEKHYNTKIFPTLDTPPDISGLTFGVDEGQLIQMTMQETKEYIGRPINIACRLQGSINEIDIKGGFRVFMSHRLFNTLEKAPFGFYDATERPLKNIGSGGNFRCYRISISLDAKFRIFNARYGSTNNTIDVTFQYTKHIKNNTLDIVVSNEVAENDPDRGHNKTLKIMYMHEGTIYVKEFKEGSRIQLP